MSSSSTAVAFIGGGNMAQAIVGGLRERGTAGETMLVIDPGEAARTAMQARFGVRTAAAAVDELAEAALVVWAVKPQSFAAAAAPCRSLVDSALHLSVMAGIRSETIAAALGNERVVRAMPNTPALIGQGIAALFARPGVDEDERARIDAVLAPTGELMWMAHEDELDAVPALAGSGPAYVFYVIEAMVDAARRMGLSDERGRRLALATLAGSTALAAASSESPATLRERVTSKGGTTHAALSVLEAHHVKGRLIEAIEAARRRARELGDEFAG